MARVTDTRVSTSRQRPWVRWAGPLLLVVALVVLPLVLPEFANIPQNWTI